MPDEVMVFLSEGSLPFGPSSNDTTGMSNSSDLGSDKENKRSKTLHLHLTLTPTRKITLKFMASQWNSSPDNTLVNSSPPPSLKRCFPDADLTNNDYHVTALDSNEFKKAVNTVTRQAVRPTKKVKTIATASSGHVNHHFSNEDGDVEMSSDDQGDDANGSFLVEPKLKRTERMVDPSKPEHAALIVQATKAGADIYDSDVEDLAGDVKGTGKPGLYRNVKWGNAATSFDNFEQTEPFVDFVPGRWERQPDGSVRDQKFKLLIKFIDLKGKQKIFKNPPPKDWNDQAALTALNKRSVQQWRRNTKYRFRKVVNQYTQEERQWILENLNAEGKPIVGWKSFVKSFNQKFEGMMIAGQGEPRPARTQSSLTKEIERFSMEYRAGRVPVPVNRAAATKSKQTTKS
jgi:hypothetical protein